MPRGRERPLYVWIVGFSISGVIFVVGLILFLVYGCKRWQENKRLKQRRMELEREMARQIDKPKEVKVSTSCHPHRGSSRVGVYVGKSEMSVTKHDTIPEEQESVLLSETSRTVTFQVPKSS